MIFLDNASTTQLCEKAKEYLIKYSCENFFNPSASYSVGFENHKKIVETKQKLCKFLNVKFENNIIFTGSATEATNLAIFGSYRKNWAKAVFSAGEHPSVYNSALALKELGVEVVFVNLQKNGQIDYSELENVLDETVNFISIMHVSNETGAINDISRIAKIKNAKCKNAILHCDGVQSFGKIKTDLTQMGVDLFTISAHKFHGPKGLGALYAKKPNKLKPIIFGGGQEYNLRSGTENLPAIMALNGALEEIDVAKNYEKTLALKNLFLQTFQNEINKDIKTLILNDEKNFSPYIISISFAGIKGEVLQNMCDQHGLFISTGSACSSRSMGNRVLENIGYSKEQVVGLVRVSFSKLSTEEDAKQGASILANCANELWRKTR